MVKVFVIIGFVTFSFHFSGKTIKNQHGFLWLFFRNQNKAPETAEQEKILFKKGN